MTRSSRARSGSRPTSLPPTKAELDAREKARQAKAEPPLTPEQRSVMHRQIVQLAALAAGGATKKDIAEASKRFAAERALLEEG